MYRRQHQNTIKRWAENSIPKTVKSAAPFGYKKCALVGILPSQ